MVQFCEAAVAVTLNVYSIGAMFESPITLAIIYHSGKESSRFFPITPNIRYSISMSQPLPSSNFQTHHSPTLYHTTLSQFEMPCHKQTPKKETVWWHETA
jgi:hypothetical protein